MIAAFLIISGLILLVAGAEMVVRGASWLATSMGVRPIILGITVVAIGTSVPELVVGITASLQGSGALAVANIAGTNVFNILFILGLSAAILPLPIDMKILRLELPVIVLSAALMTGMALDGVLTRFDGVILFATGLLYTVALIRLSRKESRATRQKFKEAYGVTVESEKDHQQFRQSRLWYALILLAGLALSVLGAEWLVRGAVGAARSMGVSEAMIGLTIVAVGTSSPELVTTIISTLKGARDIAVGNLIGSSIYNILIILGITCLAAPGIPVERELLLIDIPLMAAVALVCVPVFISGREISRAEGTAGVVLYLVYMGWLIARASTP